MKKKYSSVINQFNKKHILVVGDLILDQYIQGSVSRISPEAPVPVVLEEKSFVTPGGAANVAHNLRSLSAKVSIVGRVGKDSEGRVLISELKKKGIKTDGIFINSRVPTITKTRVIAQHQQVVRIDREKSRLGLSPKLEAQIKKFVKKNINKFDAIILSDYGKGLLTPELVGFFCALAISKKKVITVDPKVEHFTYYQGVTAITPNLKEAENAIKNIKITSELGDSLKVRVEKLITDSQINLAGRELLKFLNLQSLLITLGEKGMRVFEKGKKPVNIATQARDVFDVSGAGDTVIATFTLSVASGAKTVEAADIANFAAGVVVGKMGAVAIEKAELLEAIKKG